MSIPLGLCNEEDSLFWYYDTKGFYFVRSKYLLVEQFVRSQIPGTTTDSEWWSLIWNLEVPNKIKHFL